MTSAVTWTDLAARIGKRLAADPQGAHAVVLLEEFFDELLVHDLHGSVPARILRAMRIAHETAAAPCDTPDVDGVAAHEAAHAVFLHRFGYQIADATIDPMRDFCAQGVVFFSGYTPRAAFSFAERVRMEQRIMIELAGPVAQRIALQAHGLDGSAREWETHRRDAAQFVRRIPQNLVGDDPFAFVDWMTVRTTSEVRRSWVTIRALADQLLAVRTMTGAEVLACITALHMREVAAMETDASLEKELAA